MTELVEFLSLKTRNGNTGAPFEGERRLRGKQDGRPYARWALRFLIDRRICVFSVRPRDPELVIIVWNEHNGLVAFPAGLICGINSSGDHCFLIAICIGIASIQIDFPLFLVENHKIVSSHGGILLLRVI